MPPKTKKKSASGANGNAVEMNGLSKERTLSMESNSPDKKEKIDEDSPQDVRVSFCIRITSLA